MKLKSAAVSGAPVVVTASVARHEVAISDAPMRVEVVVPEEVQDKIAFPTDIKGALRYSGGVFVNPSKNLYEAENIRLRGVDSRYLALVMDNLPFVGFQPDEVGLWTLPLVGVKKIEVVKGDHSALYGFGQAGVINAVMRSPFNDSTRFFSIVRTDFESDHYAGVYAAHRWDKWGISGVGSFEQFGDTSRTTRFMFMPTVYAGRRTAVFSRFAGVDGENGFSSSRGEMGFVADVPLGGGKILAGGDGVIETRKFPAGDSVLGGDEKAGYIFATVGRSFGSITLFGGVNFRAVRWCGRDLAEGDSTDILIPGVLLQAEFNPSDKLKMMYNFFGGYSSVHSCGAYSDRGTDSASYSDFVPQQVLSVLFKPKINLKFRLEGSYSANPVFSHYKFVSGDTVRIFVPSRRLTPERFRTLTFETNWVERLWGTDITLDASAFLVDVSNHIDIFRTGDGLELSEFDAGYSLAGAEVFSRVDLGDDAALLFGYTFISPIPTTRTIPARCFLCRRINSTVNLTGSWRKLV